MSASKILAPGRRPLLIGSGGIAVVAVVLGSIYAIETWSGQHDRGSLVMLGASGLSAVAFISWLLFTIRKTPGRERARYAGPVSFILIAISPTVFAYPLNILVAVLGVVQFLATQVGTPNDDQASESMSAR